MITRVLEKVFGRWVDECVNLVAATGAFLIVLFAVYGFICFIGDILSH